MKIFARNWAKSSVVHRLAAAAVDRIPHRSVFLAAAGQSRLMPPMKRVHESQLRQQALSEFIALISDAESGSAATS